MYPFLSEFSVDKNTRTGLRSDEIWNKNGTLKQQIDQQESKDRKKTDRPKKPNGLFIGRKKYRQEF